MTDTRLAPCREHYNNGATKCAYSVDEKGIEQGPCEWYYNNGQLREKYTYKNGKEDGPYERYYKNYQLAEKCTYKDGEKDGSYESYHENGQLKEKGVYKMGKRLYGEEAEEYLKEWNEKHIMAPTQLRQSIKRAEVAKFRKNHPDKHAGRVIEKKNWLQKLFRGGC